MPAARGRRRTVFVMQQADIDELRSNPSTAALLARQDVAIIDASADPASADPVTAALERRNQLIAGNVLIASPYRDGDYAELADAMDAFSLEKWAAVSRLCALLGAEKLTVRQVEETESNTSWDAVADGGKGAVKAGGSARSRRAEQFGRKIDLQDVYIGGRMDVEQAQRYLAESGLESDPVMRSLVDVRSHPGNLLARRTWTIDLSRESQQVLDAALGIKVPGIFGLDAKFKHAREDKAHYKVTLDIVFHDQS